MPITTDLITAFCAGFLAVAAVIGLAVRWVLLPYLREHLVKPVARVEEQVANTHTENLRDDLDQKHDEMKELLTQHIAWSHEETNRLWTAIYDGPPPRPSR